MNGNRKFSLLIASILLMPVIVIAHHNAASHYILDQKITVNGVVTEFRLINPHVRIYFDVKTDDGEIQKWLGEGNASSVLRRRGWTDDHLKPGDVITISGAPARDGGYKIDWESIVLEDGTELRGGNTKAGELEQQLRELDKRPRRPEESSRNNRIPVCQQVVTCTRGQCMNRERRIDAAAGRKKPCTCNDEIRDIVALPKGIRH